MPTLSLSGFRVSQKIFGCLLLERGLRVLPTTLSFWNFEMQLRFGPVAQTIDSGGRTSSGLLIDWKVQFQPNFYEKYDVHVFVTDWPWLLWCVGRM